MCSWFFSQVYRPTTDLKRLNVLKNERKDLPNYLAQLNVLLWHLKRRAFRMLRSTVYLKYTQ